MVTVRLTEWEYRTPEGSPELAGVSLGTDTDVRQQTRQLAERGIVEIQELMSGLSIQAFSYVGVVHLGTIRLVIEPKLDRRPLLCLLRYAYRLRNLTLFSEVELAAAVDTFRDLLLHQLLAEVNEILARGLHRQYRRIDEPLASPRGRIRLDEIARRGVIEASLPCRHHARQADNLPNRVLLAGLHLGAHLTEDPSLRVALRRSAALLEDEVGRIRLSSDTLVRLRRQDNRLLAAYRPVFALIELIMASRGIDLEGERVTPASGFFFDMNRFFQALLSRFLREYLSDFTVVDEHRIVGMIDYVPGYNPLRRAAPVPRPDFLVTVNGRTRALLDAKYRDLWERPLPREMLYQLAMYASADRECRTAAILYPTIHPEAREMRLLIRDPIRGGERAQVHMRPVHLLTLASRLSEPVGPGRDRKLGDLAKAFAFGSASDRVGPAGVIESDY